jgi:hypothetical protein
MWNERDPNSPQADVVAFGAWFQQFKSVSLAGELVEIML